MAASGARIPGHKGGVRPEDVMDRQLAFLEAYSDFGTIKHACKKLKIGRETVYRWKKDDVNGFASHFEWAKEDFAEEIEKTVFQRALESDCPPVIQIFVLNGLKPDKYRPQTTVTDESAKDVMKELKSKFRGLKFEDSPTKDELSVHEQAENILKSKGH
jgi:hypothetical protein